MSTEAPFVIAPFDNVKVTWERAGYWRQWSINDVYMGTVGTGKIVPSPMDWLVNPLTKQTYIVLSVDENTLICTYEELGATNGGSFTDAVSNSPETYRVLVDKTVYPYAISVDRRFIVGGQDTRYARIFKGTSAADTSKIISMIFDPSGNYIDNKVVLEDTRFDSHAPNAATKSVPTCYTKEDFIDGDQVTVATYNDEGHLVSSKVMWVVISSWIASQSVDQRYVDFVRLESPFLSESNPMLIEMPVHVPVTAFNMFGVVHYSDGSQSAPIAVNSGKFTLEGLERFIGVYPGQSSEVVLRYNLDANEASYSGTKSADGKTVSALYRMITIEQRGAFTSKITGYPQWMPTTQEFKMRYFMTDLDRETMFEVTPYIYYNINSDVYDGTKLGSIQNLSLRINMKDVSSSFSSYIHTQTMAVVLLSKGDVPGANWKVAFDINQQPWFGENLVAEVAMINQGLWRVNLRNGISNQDTWLERLFYDSRPVFDMATESKAPPPTHFVIFQNNVRTEVEISEWNKPFNTTISYSLETNLYIEFIHRSNSGDLHLGVIALPVKHL